MGRGWPFGRHISFLEKKTLLKNAAEPRERTPLPACPLRAAQGTGVNPFRTALTPVAGTTCLGSGLICPQNDTVAQKGYGLVWGRVRLGRRARWKLTTNDLHEMIRWAVLHLGRARAVGSLLCCVPEECLVLPPACTRCFCGAAVCHV